jgi:hypothetical protein
MSIMLTIVAAVARTKAIPMQHERHIGSFSSRMLRRARRHASTSRQQGKMKNTPEAMSIVFFNLT